MTLFEHIAILLMIVVFSIFRCTYWKGCRSDKKRKSKKGSFVINKAEKKDDVK
jgi:hypothetical protein